MRLIRRVRLTNNNNKLNFRNQSTSTLTSSGLHQLIQHAILNRSLNPTLYQQHSQQQQQQQHLDQLLFGSLILNDQKRANYYLNRIDPTQSTTDDEFYSNLFRICGLIGRGMGMMRRVIKPLLTNKRTLRPTQIRIIEAYIENLIRWSQIERAWSLLSNFDFGPNIDLTLELKLIGGRFSERINRINKTRNQDPLWQPNSSAYSSLLSIYLILNRPDLALKLSSIIDLSSSDQAMALILCARSFTTTTQSDSLPTPPHGPITNSVLARSIYRTKGPIGFIRWLDQQQTNNSSSSDRSLLSAWLDILLLPTKPALEPIELAEWIQRLDQHDLLGERELERYLRYTRQWLESQTNSKIRRINLLNQPRSSSINQPIFIDPHHPSLGYPQLIKLVKNLYHPSSSTATTTATTTTTTASVDEQILKPSTIVVSELVRILSLIGTPPERLNELIDREVHQNQSQVRSTHMIGLAWSRIVNHDLAGLNTLIDKEIKLKYKLVLTGLLTTIILAGLIATRAPKPIIIKISQKLIDQCPTSASSSNQNDLLNQHREPDSVDGYLALINAAESVGHWILIKDLHESCLAKFGRESLYGARRPISIDYLHLIFQVYMKLNEPLLAQKEVSLSFDHLRDYYLEMSSVPLDPSSTVNHQEEVSRHFLSTGLLRDFLEAQADSKLVEYTDERYRTIIGGNGEREKYSKFIESLQRSSLMITRKLDSLGRLRRLFSRTESSQREKGEKEWEVARLAEINARLDKFRLARQLNLSLLARFNSLIPLSNPIHPSLTNNINDSPNHDTQNLQKSKPKPVPHHRRDLDWNKAMSLGLGLVRKLLD